MQRCTRANALLSWSVRERNQMAGGMTQLAQHQRDLPTMIRVVVTDVKHDFF